MGLGVLKFFDAIVVGAGAAGLYCAIEAAKRGRRLLVLEHNLEAGRKILISGGGRCNFTNLHCSPENFLSANPHFHKSALARYQPADFIAYIEKHRIRYHEKKLGQLFCDGSARQVLEALLQDCRQTGVTLFYDARIERVGREENFSVHTNQGGFASPSLVVASGGLSIPKIGASSFGYELAKQFGHRIVPCCPGLVPLLFAAADRERYAGLAGISLAVLASAAGRHYRDKLLFTHRGLSGPAILQVSTHLPVGNSLGEVDIDLLPNLVLDGSEELKTALLRHLPHRFLECWMASNSPGTSSSFPALSLKKRQELLDRMHHWKVRPSGTEGFEKAEVTAGGVDTSEISSQHMESQRVPGLYFIGEVLDVTGDLGGFNFQWAWSSGFAAGQSIR